MHFDLAEKFNLPMYLHNRNTGNDFYDLVRANRKRFPAGIVHSFTVKYIYYLKFYNLFYIINFFKYKKL